MGAHHTAGGQMSRGRRVGKFVLDVALFPLDLLHEIVVALVPNRILDALRISVWGLQGFDTFAGESYPLSGRYFCRGAAERARRWRLRGLELSQSTRVSGGQRGIQDSVFVVKVL